MTRHYLLSLKVIKILIFIWILTIFFSVFHFEEVVTTSDGELVILAFFDSLKNIMTYSFYGLLFIIAVAIIQITSIFFYINPDLMNRFLTTFFREYISSWFNFPGGTIPEINKIPEKIGEQLAVFTGDFYLFAFQLLFLISIIFAIRAFLQTNPKFDIIAIGAIIMMIVVPLMIFGFRDMLDLFYIKIDYLETLQNPLDPTFSSIPIDNFFQFLASPVILLAIVSYIYLEVAFQINYTHMVTKPSLQRSDRLEAQLEILRSESHFITANVDKIKEEAKKRREEIEKEGTTSVSKFLSMVEERFSYVKEMIEKRKLEEEEKKLITAASKTRRLGTYIERLFKEDPEAMDSLTARSSAPRAQSLILSTVINFTYRLGLLIILSFIIIHPHWFFVNVFNMPPAISESVAMYSPEVVIILLIPIMLIFPVISKIISYVKHRNLIIKLQQEGRIKEILASVGDYVRKEEGQKDELEEEVSVKQS
jgi:cell division protein FtsB